MRGRSGSGNGARSRGPRALVSCLALVLAWLGFAEVAAARAPPPPGPRQDSPLYGPPYRRGLATEIAVGVSLCQPSLVFGGDCAAHGGSPPSPGVALRLGLGWRFDARWLISAAWIRQSHRPGGSFSSGRSDGAMVAARGILPLPTITGGDSRVDLGFELGVGWSQRSLARDTAPLKLSSNGAVLRPAVVLEGWALADLAIGIEFATQLNLHWQHCVDAQCEVKPGPWVGSNLERRWVDGFTIAVHVTGMLYPRVR